MSNQLLFQIVLVLVLHCGQGTTNFALRKPAVQSSTTDYIFLWTADKAVDGNTDGSDPDNSRTCSATQLSRTPVNSTWEVNIGFLIIMKTITVYGRTDGGMGTGLSGTKLYFRNASGPSIYIQDLVNNPHVFKPTHVIASVVSLMKIGQIMVICEVTIEGECLDGLFSESCNETCGKCFADKLCNKKDGTCPSGCSQGWKGPLCIEECERGKYGYECNDTCGKCLYGNDSCSTSDGICTNGCQAGWQGVQCDKACDRGFYGFNCSEKCGNCINGDMICSPNNGKCAGGCQAGWNGIACKSECAAGTYGVNCNETCGACLNGPNKCSKIDGLCRDSCQAGWVGEGCKKECDSGFYGLNCSGTCGYCLNGSDTCLKTSGQCIGGCQAVWMGETCKSGSLGTRNPDVVCPNIGVIVGSVLAAVGATNFTIVIVVVIVRRRRTKMESGEANSENSTSAAHYMNVLADKPDTGSNVAVSCNAEKETPFSSHVKACQKRDIQFYARKNDGEELETDDNVQNNYEKLQKGTQSAESAYSTLDHDLINGNQKESMVIYQNCVKSFETAFKSVEKEISVLLSKKKKLLGDEHEKTGANLAEKLRHKKKEVENILSDKDEDYTFDNFFQTLETFERELKILEKCLLGRKGLLNHELNNITANRK